MDITAVVTHLSMPYRRPFLMNLDSILVVFTSTFLVIFFLSFCFHSCPTVAGVVLAQKDLQKFFGSL